MTGKAHKAWRANLVSSPEHMEISTDRKCVRQSWTFEPTNKTVRAVQRINTEVIGWYNFWQTQLSVDDRPHTAQQQMGRAYPMESAVKIRIQNSITKPISETMIITTHYTSFIKEHLKVEIKTVNRHWM